MNMIVEDVMTPEAVVVGPTATVYEALTTMFDVGVRHLPVVDEGELVGMLSDRDLRGVWAPPPFEPDVEASDPMGQPVSERMSGDVISVTPDTDLREVVDLMLEQKIGAVPVVESGTQDLVGVVSYVDVLRAARDLL